MSKIKPGRAFAAEHFDSFKGLGKGPIAGAKKATDIRNFRICPDGSLEKRKGWRTLRTFPERVRAYWEGKVGNSFYQFAICGKTVYSINPVMGVLEICGTLSNTYTDIEFVVYEDDLYIIDDSIRIFRKDPFVFEKLTPLDVYIPLYGKDWDPINGGAVYEQINLMTNHIRVSYHNAPLVSVFHLPFYASAIDSILVNGIPVTDYVFSSSSNTVTVPAASSAYSVEIGFEVILEINNSELLTNNRSAIYPGQHHSTLFLYNTSGACKIFRTAYVSDESLKACQALYANARSLYFRGDDVLFAGDRKYVVKALCTHNDRVLVYTDDACWEIHCSDDEKDTVEIGALLKGVGCISPNAAISCQKYPVAVNESGVYLLDFPTSGNEIPKVIKISDDISDRLTPSFLNNCIAREDVAHHELWLRDSTDTEATVLVYNLDQQQWYIFDNIYAHAFTSTISYNGFLSDKDLVIFDDALDRDDDADIVASYQSGYFSLSHPEAKKRSLRINLCADTNGNSPFLKVETESTERTFELVGSNAEPPEFFDYRVLMGRFRFLRFRLLVSGQSNCRFYNISFYANL